MSAAAQSFGSRWARRHLSRAATVEEIRVLDLMLASCGGDEDEAEKRALRYYQARGPPPHGISIWTNRRPDDEDILSSCQDVYIVPLRVRSASGRRMTVVRLPAPGAPDRPLSVAALVTRWLMILDLRVREEAGGLPGSGGGEEVLLVDARDLRASHLKNFRDSNWKHFSYCIRSAHPKKFSEIHIVNTQRLRAMSLLMLRAGVYPWSRKLARVHPREQDISQVLGDPFPTEGLPYEYGGKEGSMKDLNDEWTKKMLSSASWLDQETRRHLDTELRSPPTGQRRRSEVKLPGIKSGTYPVLKRSQSVRCLTDSLEEGPHGHYRTLKIPSDHGFYA